jgi:hypothetical protein
LDPLPEVLFFGLPQPVSTRAVTTTAAAAPAPARDQSFSFIDISFVETTGRLPRGKLIWRTHQSQRIA